MGGVKLVTQLLRRPVRIEVDRLLAWQMYGELDYGRKLLMHRVLEQPPYGFGRANIAALQMLADLVILAHYSGSSTVVALIDIFVDILHGLHGPADLDVNMGAVLAGQVRIIRDDPAIVEVSSLTVTARQRHGNGPQVIAAA